VRILVIMRRRLAGLLSVLAAAAVGTAASDGPRAAERSRMVEKQIEARGVRDERTLAAMRAVPRHRFVPPELSKHAYDDSPLPIGSGQTISQPYIVAFMTEAAQIRPGDKVLEIGTGSGYQAAVLAELSDQVYTIEIIPELAARAAATLKDLGHGRVHVRTGDGYQGWPEEAPFDVILITAAPEKIPPPLLEQLKEGGRMVIPVGPQQGGQELLLVTKQDGKIKRRTLLPVRFVPFTRS